jgi:hypothetical protein
MSANSSPFRSAHLYDGLTKKRNEFTLIAGAPPAGPAGVVNHQRAATFMLHCTINCSI